MAYQSLTIDLNANLQKLQADLDQASTLSQNAAARIQKSADAAGDSLGDAANAADFVKLSADAQAASASIDGITKSSTGAGTALDGVSAKLSSVLDQLQSDAKERADQVGTGTKIAVAAGVAAIGYGLVQIGELAAAAAFRFAEAGVHVAEFAAGLITGSSLQSKYTDALIEANKRVGELQSSLAITAQSATALEFALERIGTPQGDYTAVYTATEKAINSNVDAFNLLGVAYQDAKGKLLPVQTVIQNAATVLDGFTAGLDRNAAAAALGLGSADKVAAAAKLNAQNYGEAATLLQQYYLLIGPGSQAAVEQYQQAMRIFRSEADLTSQGLQRAVADATTPTLTEFAKLAEGFEGFPDAVAAARGAMTGLLGVFELVEVGVKALKDTADATWDSLISSTTAAFGAIDKAVHIDFSAAKQEIADGAKAIEDRFSQLVDKLTANRDKADAALALSSGVDNQKTPGLLDKQAPAKTFFGPIDFGTPDPERRCIERRRGEEAARAAAQAARGLREQRARLADRPRRVPRCLLPARRRVDRRLLHVPRQRAGRVRREGAQGLPGRDRRHRGVHRQDEGQRRHQQRPAAGPRVRGADQAHRRAAEAREGGLRRERAEHQGLVRAAVRGRSLLRQAQGSRG